MTSSNDRKPAKRVACAKIGGVEGILRRWDPIGVEPGVVGPADEYDSYAPHIVSMVERGCSVEELAAHLEYLATSVIGFGSDVQRSAKFAAEIVHSCQS